MVGPPGLDAERPKVLFGELSTGMMGRLFHLRHFFQRSSSCP